MSCEPSRTRAYDIDLRWRMVHQRLILDLSVKQISQNLCVDPSTVRRTIDLFMVTGDVAKLPYPVDHGKKLTELDQIHILDLVLEKPGIYLHENLIKHHLLLTYGTEVSIATICRFLHSSSFSRTKIRSVALQRNDECRASYFAEVALYNPDMFVFIDETGSDRRSGMRQYGYALRGKRCVSRRLLARGNHISAIAALSLEGIVGYQ